MNLRFLSILMLALVSTCLNAQTAAHSSVNHFAFESWQRIKATRGENACTSPLSIATAFGMLYPGAKTQSEKELSETFKFGDNSDAFYQSCKDLSDQLLSYNTKGVDLRLANALFVQKGFKLQPHFLEANQKYFTSGLIEKNFATKADPSRKEINTWVEENTNNRIKDLLPEGSVSADTRLVLVNTLFFKAAWKTSFDKERTRKNNFTTAKGDRQWVDMMRQENTVKYFQDQTFKAIELPYKDEKISMVILLPHENKLLADVRGQLTESYYQTVLSGMLEAETDIILPVFKTEYTLDLNTLLTDMGMTACFTPGASDFSGITGGRDLFISGAFHKTFVEVTEEGTEAAAATAIVMRTESSEPSDEFQKKVFHATRPFIYIIKDNATQTVMFLGQINVMD